MNSVSKLSDKLREEERAVRKLEQDYEEMETRLVAVEGSTGAAGDYLAAYTTARDE